MLTRRIAAFGVALGFVGLLPLAAQDEPNKPKELTTEERQDLTALVQVADSMVDPLPNDFSVTWRQSHFLRSQDGKTFVPFTLQIDAQSLSAPAVALYVRAVSKTAAPPAPPSEDADNDDTAAAPRIEYPWDDIHYLDVPADGLVTRGLALSAGDYQVIVGVKERATGAQGEVSKTSMFRRDVSVPDFTKAELATSSIILASDIVAAEPLTPEEQRAHPYSFVSLKALPSLDGKYQTSGTLNVLFWVYGLQPDSMQKPDVQIEYSFHQQLPEGEKYFNKTAPQVFSAQAGLPAEFDLSVGHLVPGLLQVPLASFPPGDYRCEIKVSDRAAGTSVTQNVEFNVAG